MIASEEDVVKRIAELGVNNVHIRPASFRGWAILHQLDMYTAETLFTAPTEEECRELIRQALNCM